MGACEDVDRLKERCPRVDFDTFDFLWWHGQERRQVLVALLLHRCGDAVHGKREVGRIDVLQDHWIVAFLVGTQCNEASRPLGSLVTQKIFDGEVWITVKEEVFVTEVEVVIEQILGALLADGLPGDQSSGFGPLRLDVWTVVHALLASTNHGNPAKVGSEACIVSQHDDPANILTWPVLELHPA